MLLIEEYWVRALRTLQVVGVTVLIAVMLSSCGGKGQMAPPPPPSQFSLAVSATGSGTITSAPAGINCGPTCSASFSAGTSVTLTATPASNDSFSGWSGACS